VCQLLMRAARQRLALEGLQSAVAELPSRPVHHVERNGRLHGAVSGV